jgi:hypothetical protein
MSGGDTIDYFVGQDRRRLLSYLRKRYSTPPPTESGWVHSNHHVVLALILVASAMQTRSTPPFGNRQTS